MNIIILGCGKVGTCLAKTLNQEGHNITIIDQDEAVLKSVASSLDVRGVTGKGAMLSVLQEAGIEDANLFIAVTNSDEVNMLSCLLAKKEGNVSTIARIRNPEYEEQVVYLKDELGLAMVINPEKAVAKEIFRLLHFPSALEIETFANGKIEMIKMRINKGSRLCNVSLKDMHNMIHTSVLIVLVQRGTEVIIPKGDFVLQENDAISFIARRKEAIDFCKECDLEYAPNKGVILIGGGKISYYLATEIVNSGSKMNLKIIEKKHDRCVFLASEFPDATIIEGDGTDQGLLEEEGALKADAIVALTGIDEENIIANMLLGKAADAMRITKINHMDSEMVESELNVGAVVCTRNVMSDAIVRFVRGLSSSSDDEDMLSLYLVADGKAEAYEFIVNDETVIDIPLMNLKMKDQTLIASIIRGRQIIRPSGTDVLKKGDRLVVMTANTGMQKLKDILA